MSVWVIVVAAGSGRRFGAAKQFVDLDGESVLSHALAPSRRAGDGVVLVVPAGFESDARRSDPDVAVVTGGSTRAESVRAGLAAVPADADVVVVHDAARPLASDELFRSVVAAVRAGADGAVPGIEIADTVKQVAGSVVVSTIDRSLLRAVQTPQAFDAAILRLAHADGGDATDDAALVESRGGRVVVVPGEPGNVKITTPSDLESVRAQRAAR